MALRWQIRPVSRADTAAIAAAERRCFSDPWSLAGVEALLENESLVGRVATGAGQNQALAGYLLARSIAGEAEILTLAVLPEARRRGMGMALLEAVLLALRQVDVAAVFLEVRESNEAARALYRRSGFRPVGVRADYYRNPPENAVVLRLGMGSV